MQLDYPDRQTAEQVLCEAGRLNPGAWIEHSRYTALACEAIAFRCSSMDSEKAYVLGLLHDIGRRVGIVSERHMLEGYHYCIEKHWKEAAKICITHSFVIQDIKTSIGVWDISVSDYEFMKQFIQTVIYDKYDKLVQLCDSLALPTGFCLLEKRFVDVACRYGVNDYIVPRWRATFEIKNYFESLINGCIYDLLPGVRENTFSF